MHTPPPPRQPAHRVADDWSLAITDGLTVHDLVRVAPCALSVLWGRGVDGDVGRTRTLADVARRHQLALDQLLDELREAATEDAGRHGAYVVASVGCDA